MRVRTWRKVKPVFETFSQRFNDPAFGSNFRLLHNEALKRNVDIKVPDDIPLYEQTRLQE